MPSLPPATRRAALEVVERLHAAFVVLDREGRLEGVNRAAEQLLGASRASLVGERLERAAPVEARRAFEAAFRGVVADGQTRNFTTDVGERSFDVEVADGGSCILAIWHDVSARRRVEEERDQAREDASRARRAAAEERHLRETLFEGAPALISLFSVPELRYVFVNALAREAAGGRDLVGLTVREAHPEIAGTPLLESLEEVLRTGIGGGVAEVPITLLRDGVEEPRYFTLRYHPHRNEAGEVERILTVGFDVTEHVLLRRKLEALAEERLRMAERLEEKRARVAESESRLARLFEGNLVGSVFWTMDGRVTRANDAFLDLVGHTREDVATGTLQWRSMEVPELAEGHPIAIAQLLETGRSLPQTKELVRKDGSRVPVLVSALMFPGSQTEGIAFVVDLTDIRRAEEREVRLYAFAAALSRAATPERIGASYAASAGEAVPLVRALVLLRSAEDGVETLARLPAEGPPAEADAAARSLCEAALAAGGRATVHRSVPPALADEGVVAAFVAPLVADGDLLGATFLGLRRQPTDDERRFVLALETLTAQALERAGLLSREQALRQKAETASRTKDEFLATISHELRTPLNALLGWSRMLCSGALSEAQQARALEVIERNAVAQAQLIDDLLDVSRIVTGKLRLDIQSVDVRVVVEHAADAVRPAAAAKELDLAVDVSVRGPLRADATRLQQIVWNLLSNAVKFTPPRGRVRVTARDVDREVEIAVIDSGDGIAPEYLPHMFERFSQADGSITRRHAGLGLGLAICRHLAELHGGTVHASSGGRGKGATFVVRIPRVTDAGTGRYRTRGYDAPMPPVRGLEGLRVLVVEDDEDARELIGAILAQSGVVSRLVGSGAAAMDEVREHTPDVILCDVGLPDEDGYSFVRRLRALPPERGGRIPAAALTAYASAEDRRRAVVAGFHMHVPKPVDPRELVDVVASLARIAEATR